jgi:uncharacterized membrane protein
MRAVSKIRRVTGARRDDQRGATLVFTAICMVLLLWGGAMGIDLGLSVWGSRQAQAMADTTALDMVRYINLADDQSNPTAYLGTKMPDVDIDNASNATLSVTAGYWNGTTFAVPSYGCRVITPVSPAEPPCNAVQVTAGQSVPQIFYGGSRIITGHGSGANGSSVAAETPDTSFSIGTYLASYSPQETAVLNVILDSLGTSASVTAVGYQGLANTYVTLNQLITASGTLLTPSNVMTQSLPGSEWSTIWQAAVDNQVAQLNCGSSPTPGPCNAGPALAALGSWSTSASLCQMVSINGSGCGIPTTPELSSSLNVLQMLTTEAEAANGTNALNLTSALDLTVPGLTISNVQLFLNQGQLPQVAYGATSTTASTSQVTADLQMNLSIGAVSLGLLDVPLSAASGTAKLNSLVCLVPSLGPTLAKINVTTTATNAAVTLAGVNQGTLAINGVTNGAASFASSGSGSVVPPTAATVQSGSNPKSVGTSSPTFTATGTLNPLVSTLLSSVLPSALAPVLQAAGVEVANADVADLSVDCGAVSLVQ